MRTTRKQEALELLTGQTPNEQFDVLICDIALPDEDGYAVIQKVRALPLAKSGDIPAVARYRPTVTLN
jgi:CheY-like chemotaxis protein